MSQEQGQLVKATVAGALMSPSAPSANPDVETILQNLQLADPAVLRILKGDLHDQINYLSRLIAVSKEKKFEDYIKGLDMATANAGTLEKLLDFVATMKQVAVSLQTIELQLPHYYKMIPFILMLSPLMWLSNLTPEVVAQIKSKQEGMVHRLRLENEDDEDEQVMSTSNFYDSILTLMHVIVSGSEGGWKSKVLTEERKSANLVISDTSRPAQGKSRWKFW